MSQQEDEPADLRQEARTPLPEFLTGRLAWVGLGAVTSLVVASAAFAQGVWNGDETANTRPSAAGQDQASEALRSQSSGSALSGSGHGLPSVEVSSRPRDDRAPAYRPGKRVRKPSKADPTPASKSASDGTPVIQVSAQSGATSAKTPTESPSKPRSTTKVQPSIAAWGSRLPEDNPYWDAHVVTVRSDAPVTSLKVSVRVKQTGGVFDTGTWTSLGDRVDVWFAANNEELSYVVVLKPGVTLQPGTYHFQFGFNHDVGNRDAGGDLWNAVATADGFSTSQRRSGRF